MENQDFVNSLLRINNAVSQLRQELKSDIEKTKLDITTVIRMDQKPAFKAIHMTWLAISEDGKEVVKNRFPPSE